LWQEYSAVLFGPSLSEQLLVPLNQQLVPLYVNMLLLLLLFQARYGRNTLHFYQAPSLAARLTKHYGQQAWWGGRKSQPRQQLSGALLQTCYMNNIFFALFATKCSVLKLWLLQQCLHSAVCTEQQAYQALCAGAVSARGGGGGGGRAL
jgi:hypothetical protein